MIVRAQVKKLKLEYKWNYENKKIRGFKVLNKITKGTSETKVTL